MNLLDRTIVALDNMTTGEIFDFLARSENSFSTVKIGLEMFCQKGPEFVKLIHEKYGVEIFLDLKLHDIPNTVRKAIRSLKGLPIKFLTIHLSGGREMLCQAVEERNASLPNTNLLGVSFLTSLGENDLNEMFNFSSDDVKDAFKNLFTLALETGVHGVVSSPMEIDLIKSVEEKSERKLIKVTPGIRFADEIKEGVTQDQKRINTPEKTVENGASYLVIGRSLTQAKDLNKRISELAK